MAAKEEKGVHGDPNFAVICSFLERYGYLLAIPDISFSALQTYLEDTRYVTRMLEELLIKLLRRWKTSVRTDKWESFLIKFCHTYSQLDAWELERFGFARSKLETKLRVVKNLLELQFDVNPKFKEKINEKASSDLRILPVGRDRNGLAYWYLLDRDLNVRVYREEPDDHESESWEMVVTSREDLASLIANLEKKKDSLWDEASRSVTPSVASSRCDTPSDKNFMSAVDPDDVKQQLKMKIKYKVDENGGYQATLAQGNQWVKQEADDTQTSPYCSEYDEDTDTEAAAGQDVVTETDGGNQKIKEESENSQGYDTKISLREKKDAENKDKTSIESQGTGIKREGDEDVEKDEGKKTDNEETTEKDNEGKAEKEDGYEPKEKKTEEEKKEENCEKKEKEMLNEKSDEKRKPAKRKGGAVKAGEGKVSREGAKQAETRAIKKPVKRKAKGDEEPTKVAKEADPKDPNATEKDGKLRKRKRNIGSESDQEKEKSDKSEKSESDISDDTQSEELEFNSDEPPSKRKRGKTLKKTLPKNRTHPGESDDTDEDDDEVEEEATHSLQLHEKSPKLKKSPKVEPVGQKDREEEEEDKDEGDKTSEEDGNKEEEEEEREGKKKKLGRGRRRVEEEKEEEPSSKKGRPSSQSDRGRGSRGRGRRVRSVPEIPPDPVLRRSSRANKGQRIIDTGVIDESSQRREQRQQREAEDRRQRHEEKERRKQERENKRRKKEKILKKKKKNEGTSDEEFVPGNKKGRKKPKGSYSSSSDDDDDIDLFDALHEEEDLKFASPSETELELDSDGEEYVPSGRNAKRQEALKKKKEAEAAEEEEEEWNCLRCGKGDQPEWILLCDNCDTGFHTGCLRPPLMMIPHGDWFCPPCEHKTLIEKLSEKLSVLEEEMKANERLLMRKARLAFVNISLNNVISHEGRGGKGLSQRTYKDDSEEEDEDEDEEEEVKWQARKERDKRCRQRAKDRERRRKYFYDWEQDLSSESECEESSESESGEEYSMVASRSKRKRKDINYKFEDYDEMIDTAIKEESKVPVCQGKDIRTIVAVAAASAREEEEEETGGGKNIENIMKAGAHKPAAPSKQVRSRGKSIENITGMKEVVEKEEANRPEPVTAKWRKKKGRKLTALDSGGEKEETGDTDEYKATDDSVVSGDEHYEPASDFSEESLSDYWTRKERKSHHKHTDIPSGSRRSSRRRKVNRKYESDDSEEEERHHRKSLRHKKHKKSNKHKKDKDKKAKKGKNKGICYDSSSQSESDLKSESELKNKKSQLSKKTKSESESEHSMKSRGKKSPRTGMVYSDDINSGPEAKDNRRRRHTEYEGNSDSDPENESSVSKSRRQQAGASTMIKAVASLDGVEDSGEHSEGEEKNTDHKQTSQTKGKSSDKENASSSNNRTCDLQKSAGLQAQINGHSEHSTCVAESSVSGKEKSGNGGCFMIDNLLKDTKSGNSGEQQEEEGEEEAKQEEGEEGSDLEGVDDLCDFVLGN